MNNSKYMPVNAAIAAAHLTGVGQKNCLPGMSREAFIRVWYSISYLYPGLHADECESEDGGWPKHLLPFVTEAWRRANAGMLSDEQLYPSDAAWAGLYDRMSRHSESESLRRAQLNEFTGGETR